jgi:hypothetical protein
MSVLSEQKRSKLLNKRRGRNLDLVPSSSFILLLKMKWKNHSCYGFSMTNVTTAPANLDETIARASHGTTVFSDGSTFDYENGYRSNGATIATRDRTVAPRIVKSHKIVTLSRVLGVLLSLTVLTLLASFAFLLVAVFQGVENIKAVKAGINESSQVEVVQTTGNGEIIVKDAAAGNMFKCDVSIVSNGGNPTGLVFCAGEGKPATFSIPVPHDPKNIFYVAPDKDAEHKG